MEYPSLSVDQIVRLPMGSQDVETIAQRALTAIDQDLFLLEAKRGQSRHADLVSICLRRARSIFKSILSLALQQSGDECMILTRALADAVITLGYIGKSPDERVGSYFQYEAIRTVKFLKMVDIQRNIVPLVPELLTQEQRSSLEAKYSELKRKWRQEGDWGESKTKARADGSGLSWLYFYYKMASDFVHGNVLAFVGNAAGPSDAYPALSNMALFAATVCVCVAVTESYKAIGIANDALSGNLSMLLEMLSGVRGTAELAGLGDDGDD